jgi:AhpD family alkylhydroperoxidase
LPFFFGFYLHSKEIVMTKEVLSQKEKELIAVGGSVAAGCVKCSHYHFRQAFEQGANQDEVLRAVIGATEVIKDSVEILQHTAYELMDVERDEVTTGINEATDSLTVLIKLAAAVAVNNVANTRRHIEVANRLGASSAEIHLAIKLAKVIQNRAGKFVDEEIEEFTAESVAEN